MKSCVFCGKNSNQVKITKEHVLPRWMKRELSHAKSYHYSSDYIGHVPVTRDVKGQTSFDMTVSRVCQQCNNGWMSQKLEAPLKNTLLKMILGEVIKLDEERLNLLCLWSFKTAITRALMDNGKACLPSEYYSKAANLEIPNGCSIYLADRGQKNEFYCTRYTTVGTPNRPSFIFSLEIRSLVIFVICSDHQEIGALLNHECERINHPENIIKIWPPLPSLVMAINSPRVISWPLNSKLPFPCTYFCDVVLSYI
ncbi:TPA: hypothetical protein MIG94_11680 [Klebsiella pneumoniae]|uniref:hypothetical protein n=1 Tax=Klebsiella quasipneumoniae TaxID=1463165 RepID=UPI00376846A2|nr:hypothetical protein [Klebsiella pneumoniae]